MSRNSPSVLARLRRQLEHTIVGEKVLPPEPRVHYPICVDGKLQGPPEDGGGIPDYHNLLEALSNPVHPEREDMFDWVGGQY